MKQPTQGRARCAALALALAALVALSGSAPVSDDGRRAERGERGRLLYTIYCVNCHGASGKGDGPTAEILTVRPADLTTLRARNRGTFPEERIERTIDGRDGRPGHGAGQMPIWGLGFQELDRDTDQEAEVRAKILALVEYLETIQVDGD